MKPWMNYELWKGIEEEKEKKKQRLQERKFEYLAQMEKLGIKLPQNAQIFLEEEEQQEETIIIEGDNI